jgi:tetratricopeptide (TPR) repeat protein
MEGANMTTPRAFLALSTIAFLSTVHADSRSDEQFFSEEGRELYIARKYEAAIAAYEKLIAINPQSWDGNYLIAVSCLALYHPGADDPQDMEYVEKGIAAFERTLKLTPPSPEAKEKTEKYYLAFLDVIGDKDKAIAYLEEQLEQRPNELALINQIATLYQKQGDFEKSLEYFEKRANMEPNSREAWYTLGVNCWARSYHGGVTVGQEERERVVDRGIVAFEKALAVDPDYFDALAYMNLIYREKAKALAAVGLNIDAEEAFAKADEYKQRAIEIRQARP